MAKTPISKIPQGLSLTEEEDSRQDISDLAGGALVNLVGKAGRLSRGLFLWVVALLCGAEVLGLYALAWGVVYTFSRVGRFGLHRGVTRFVVEARAAGDQDQAERTIAAALLIGLLTSVPLAALTALAAPWAAAFYSRPELGASIRLMAWCIPLLTLISIFVEAIRALRIMRFGVYVMSIAGPLLLLAGGLVTGLADLGLFGLGCAQLLSVGGMALLAFLFFGRFYSAGNCLRHLASPLPWRPLFRFCFLVMLNDLLYAILLRLDIFMLGAYIAPDGIGIYSVAKRISSGLLKVPQSLTPIFSPIVSDLFSRGQRRRLGARFASVTRWILTIDLPLFGAILIAGETVLLLFGGEFTAGKEALVVLALAVVLQGVFAPAELLLVMSGRAGLNLFNNLLWLAGSFLLYLLFVPDHGILGAAAAAVLASLLVSLLRLMEVRLLLQIHPFHRSLLPPLLAAAGAAAGAWLLGGVLPAALWANALLLAVFLASFFLLLLFLGIDPEDRLLLKRAIRRLRRTS